MAQEKEKVLTLFTHKEGKQLKAHCEGVRGIQISQTHKKGLVPNFNWRFITRNNNEHDVENNQTEKHPVNRKIIINAKP